MQIDVLVTVEVDEVSYSERHGFPIVETAENVATEFLRQGDALTWRVDSVRVVSTDKAQPTDVVQTILSRPHNGPGGGIPLTRGEVAMLFLDGHAGDGPGFLDIRSHGYGTDDDWDGITTDDVMEDSNTVFVWSKWEPLELWPERLVA